ncbi:uncharacterized protein DUF1572 [Thermoflavifilum aggregans]|uniref:Uncharacterized protein DUF1572 n=1 Tax=Thermoflavifilum aggregans TaxID=454188 RepID=A0A2M9CWB6_9BACT|nr:DUF1572 family protein [Thermoflavifilum aggregans]PJJ76206.1 uncharacterized protein DUF1572 [Thermoflavifilum aggregans]
MNLADAFLDSIRARFQMYRELAEKTFEQLNDEDFYYRPDPSSNSIAILIQHMAGNLRSRFTDFLNSDGEKPWRNRDQEFEDQQLDRNELMQQWQQGWKCLFDALDSLKEQDLVRHVTIRDEPLTVIDALHRQLAHQAYHVGQIVYLGKVLKKNRWKTLSIPRKNSPSA